MGKTAPLSIVPVKDIPKAVDVPTNNLLDVFRLITKMEAICTAQNGIGLSAVQVGIPWRLFIVQRGLGYEYYLNCEYNGTGEKMKSVEGCLSLRDSLGNLRRFEVDRYQTVTVKGKRLRISDSPSLVLEDVNMTEKDLYAVVFQHEIDHQFQRERMIDVIGTEIEFSA
jgi:peptide deformylase